MAISADDLGLSPHARNGRQIEAEERNSRGKFHLETGTPYAPETPLQLKSILARHDILPMLYGDYFLLQLLRDIDEL